MDAFVNRLLDLVPAKSRIGLWMWWFGHFKIPLVGHVGPRIVEAGDESVVVVVPLRRRSRNHLGSLYFGALALAADVTAALPALARMQERGYRISLVFKDFSAQFLKRADGDTHFTTDQVAEIREFVDRVAVSGQRENLPVRVVATVPSRHGQEPVASFVLTLSMKASSSK